MEVLKLLLDRKANANLQGCEYAAAYANVAAVKLLLECGADPTVSGVWLGIQFNLQDAQCGGGRPAQAHPT